MGVIIIDVIGEEEDQEEAKVETQKERPKQLPEAPLLLDLEIIPIEN